MTASRKVIKDVFCWKQKYFWNQYQPSLICQLFPQSLGIIWKISILECGGASPFQVSLLDPPSAYSSSSGKIGGSLGEDEAQSGGGTEWVDLSLENWYLLWLPPGQRRCLKRSTVEPDAERLGWWWCLWFWVRGKGAETFIHVFLEFSREKEICFNFFYPF